jgi:chromosome partitioning protein
VEKTYWTSSDVNKLYRLEMRGRSRQTLLNAEERGEIPKAARVQRGRYTIRQWETGQLPAIGSRFGFLKKSDSQQVICVYTAKGGVLKTTLAYCLARILALNGIKTLIVGLDIQCSITETALPSRQIDSLEQFSDTPTAGLYDVLFGEATVGEVVKRTALPTLDVIPENAELNPLEKSLRLANRREYVLKDKLLPLLSDYDAVIFDNGPSWNALIENALVAANTVISPVGCDLGTYQAVKTNLKNVTDFQKHMQLTWDNFLLVPTLLEKSKLSQQIYGAYLTQYGDNIMPVPIRRAIKGQEALLMRQTPLESDPSSQLAQDYYELSTQLWERIAVTGRTTVTAQEAS